MRPMYIQKIRAIFPQKCTTEVTPTLTPVVAKAETVSNRASRSVKVAASVTGPAKTTVVAIGIISKAKNIMANARNITFAATRRLRIIGSSLPRITLRAVVIKTAAVVTLIPPPVEPGAAPINMSKIHTIFVISRMAAMSTVLNPAVRMVVD